jgi:hypothetical protein
MLNYINLEIFYDSYSNFRILPFLNSQADNISIYINNIYDKYKKDENFQNLILNILKINGLKNLILQIAVYIIYLKKL